MASLFMAMLTVFGLGIAYFIVAIPVGVSMKLHPALAALCAALGYSFIAGVMLVIGTPARDWICRKLRLCAEPDPSKLFWRIWAKAGMPGLGLIAPVTCGPYFAALIALALREKPSRVIFWIAVGVIPWCIGFALAAAAGARLFG